MGDVRVREGGREGSRKVRGRGRKSEIKLALIHCSMYTYMCIHNNHSHKHTGAAWHIKN